MNTIGLNHIVSSNVLIGGIYLEDMALSTSLIKFPRLRLAFWRQGAASTEIMSTIEPQPRHGRVFPDGTGWGLLTPPPPRPSH